MATFSLKLPVAASRKPAFSKKHLANFCVKIGKVKIVLNILRSPTNCCSAKTYLVFHIFRIDRFGLCFGSRQFLRRYTRFSTAILHIFGHFNLLLLGDCLRNKNHEIKLIVKWEFLFSFVSLTWTAMAATANTTRVMNNFILTEKCFVCFLVEVYFVVEELLARLLADCELICCNATTINLYEKFLCETKLEVFVFSSIQVRRLPVYRHRAWGMTFNEICIYFFCCCWFSLSISFCLTPFNVRNHLF